MNVCLAIPLANVLGKHYDETLDWHDGKWHKPSSSKGFVHSRRTYNASCLWWSWWFNNQNKTKIQKYTKVTGTHFCNSFSNIYVTKSCWLKKNNNFQKCVQKLHRAFVFLSFIFNLQGKPCVLFKGFYRKYISGYVIICYLIGFADIFTEFQCFSVLTRASKMAVSHFAVYSYKIISHYINFCKLRCWTREYYK